MFRYSKDISVEIKPETVKICATTEYHCDLCGQGPWSSELDVDIHRKNEHKTDLLRDLKDKNIHMCSICLRVQSDKQALIEHILVNHFHCPPNATMINREIFICDHCHNLFFNKQLLITHMFHWHTKKTPENIRRTKYNCPLCWKVIKAKSSWFHLLYHGCFNVGTCPICLKTFESHKKMLEHVKTHPNTFRCIICNYETTKEVHLNNHLAKHNKIIEFMPKDDASRFFLPNQMVPSLNNRMTHIFKGIPLANEVKICVLCKALVFSPEEMEQHIFASHVPEEKLKSKTHQCYCGEIFFNSVLLKHHVFKMKGNHGVWDGVSPIPIMESNDGEPEMFNVYQLYGFSSRLTTVSTDGNPLSIGMNEIIIDGLPSHADTEGEENHIMEYEVMET